MTDIEKALAWADEEYKRRTQAIKSGESTNVDWLHPDYRVSVVDILAYATKNALKVDRFELQQAIVARSGRRYR